MTEEPEVWGTWAVGGIEEARVGPTSTKQSLRQAIAGRMQENQRNGQDDSDIVETSEPFTVTPAALNSYIISSADYHWLKQGPVNQPTGHLSASLSGPEGVARNFLKSFR